MNHRDVRRAAVALLWIAAAAPLSAQNDMRGHWSGSLDTPAGALTLEFDLDRAASGWIGTVTIPAQGASGLPLDAISFKDGNGTFRIKGAPGDPTFTGALSSDGKMLQGNFSQGAGSFPLKLARTGEPKVETVTTNPAVAPEFVGTWEGTIEAGPGLRIVLTISNGKAGVEALMVSVDQGNAQIPVSAIIQKGTKLTLQVNAISGGYECEINKEGTELHGTWTQLGSGSTLQFKRAAKK